MFQMPEPEMVKMLQFFSYHTGSIEILFNEQLVRVYFPIQPICRMISKTTRQALMRDIPRESPSEKVEGLMVNSNELYDEMEHLAYLKTLVFNFSSDRLNLLRDLSTIIGFLINISMVATYALVLDD